MFKVGDRVVYINTDNRIIDINTLINTNMKLGNIYTIKCIYDNEFILLEDDDELRLCHIDRFVLLQKERQDKLFKLFSL